MGDYTVQSVLDSLLDETDPLKKSTTDKQGFDELIGAENTRITAINPEAIAALIHSEKEDATRKVLCVPALNLKRCASFKELDWLDSFLWLTSETYREETPTPVQNRLCTLFFEEIKMNEDLYTFLFERLRTFPGGIEQFGIEDAESFTAIFYGDDTFLMATLLAYAFGYTLHVFSYSTGEFFNPIYLSKEMIQTKTAAIFMIETVKDESSNDESSNDETSNDKHTKYHLEPLFELGSSFGTSFSWNDTALCDAKRICNEVVDPDYELPADCETVPSGTDLESLNDWMTRYFSTRLTTDEDDPEIFLEQPIIDDSRSYPLPKLATKVRHQKKGAILEIDLPTQVKIQQKILENKWTVAKTVGDGTCLVHSILQSTSEAYRSIPHNERALVGQWYRYSVLPTFYDETSKFEEPLFERLKDSTEFLEDIDLSKIVNGLDINVVVVNTTQRIIKIVTPVTQDAESIEIFKGKPYIFLLNSGALHFSSIYLGAQQKFLLTEAEMLDLYPEIVDEMYKDKDYKDVRKELVQFVRSSGANNSVKEPIVQNIYRHVRPREGEGAPVAPDMHGRNLEGKLDAYAGTLGISPRNFNRFRQTLRNTTSGGGRGRKTRKV